MRQYIRLKAAGACYFFTVVSYKRRKILCLPEVRSALHQAIINVRQDMPFDIVAWVLLPDHMHCIWTLPVGDDNYSARWSRIKRFVSQQCRHLVVDEVSRSLQRKREVGFWQRRFWEHKIRDDDDLHNHLNYIHFNPVKHGYCQYAEQWQWSTLLRYIAQGKYPSGWGQAVDIPDGVGYE